MLPPVHDYLENPLDSMRASFEAGADIVEIDVHPTTDGQFAVFHDWTLECRTDGTGVTREHTMTELKALDIGYGYTADGGRTFPFRGRGVGEMPSLDEVLSTFPQGRFLINVKSRDLAEGVLLAEVLGRLSVEERSRIMVYGGEEPVEALRTRLPDVLTTSRAAVRECLLAYMAIGWTSAVPEACQERIVLVPINVAPWFWGWPRRFVNRMEASGSRVFLLGPYEGGDFSTRMDRPEDFARVPREFTGGLYTNEIEAAAAFVNRRAESSN
jgi:glycerophosphoryl diester phosphodiesterase